MYKEEMGGQLPAVGLRSEMKSPTTITNKKQTAIDQTLIRVLMIVSIICLSAMVISCPDDVMAADGIPAIVISGLNAYKDGGPEVAIKSWVKGSAVENSVEAQSQASVFRQVETVYGKYIGYEFILSKRISKNTEMVYLVMNYEKGPVFASFLVYKNQGTEIIAQLNFHTKPEAILPQALLAK